LYCSHAKQIRDPDELQQQLKPLCELATVELFPNETGKQQKMTKVRLGLMP